MEESTFFFSETVTPERARWVVESISTSSGAGGRRATVFLTGDALYSLVDEQSRESWKALSVLFWSRIVADRDELQLHGLLELVSLQIPGLLISGRDTERQFWPELVDHLSREWAGTRRMAFLLCHAPYMSRVPVHMLRFLSSAQAAGFHPELYAYLDGLHNVHNGQRPSEFENIGRGISAIAGAASLSGRDPWFAACSRCATARGYYQMNPGTGYCEPASCNQDITIRPLKEILSRFSGGHPIISHASGGTVRLGGSNETAGVPGLVVLITKPPYGTEWAFGGLSLSLAAAMDGTPTMVLFIEDGVHALSGSHEIPGSEKVFNVQEMIAVTGDIPALRYLVHAPSLQRRGLSLPEQFSSISEIQNEELAGIIRGNTPDASLPATRVLFF